jgi:hypothetical protein
MVRLADGVDSTNPFPNPGNVTASSLADSSADVSIALDEAGNSSPELFATLALELKAKDVIP